MDSKSKTVLHKRSHWNTCIRIFVFLAITVSSLAKADEAGASNAPVTSIVLAAITGAGGILAWFIREVMKHSLAKAIRETEKDWAEGMIKPVKLPPPAKRNSVILIGLGGTGKTTLIRSLLQNPDANPAQKTEDYSLYHGERNSNGRRHHLYISDYRGQHLGDLVRAFIKQQKIKYSPMAYGYVNSLVLVVDIEEPPTSPSEIEPNSLENPNVERIKKQLTEWSATALDGVFGFFTADTLKYVCLFINKADLLTTRNEQAVRSLYKSLELLLQERCNGAKFKVYVGSVRSGEKVVSLEEDLMMTAVDVEDTRPSAVPSQSPQPSLPGKVRHG